MERYQLAKCEMEIHWAKRMHSKRPPEIGPRFCKSEFGVVPFRLPPGLPYRLCASGEISDPTQDEVANRGGQRHERTIEARLDACRAVYVRRDRHGVDRHVLVVPDGLVSLQNASIPQAS